MSVGFQAVRGDIDHRAGQLAVDVRNKLFEVGNFKVFLDAQTDQMLLDLGYTSGDITLLRSAITDLDKIRQIYAGLATQSSTYNFQTFAKLLTGVQ